MKNYKAQTFGSCCGNCEYCKRSGVDIYCSFEIDYKSTYMHNFNIVDKNGICDNYKQKVGK